MGRLYWLLNIVLLAAAATIIGVALRQDPHARWQSRQGLHEQDRGRGEGQRPGRALPIVRASAQAPGLEGADDLWRHSLFRPDRTEEIATDGDGDGEGAKEQEQLPEFDLELVGVGIIEDRRAAIILNKGSRRVVPPRPTPAAARGALRRSHAVGTPTPTEKPKWVQRVFRVNDEVGETGYTVKEIELDQVVLIRGEEERILKMHSDEEASERRRAEAVKAQEERAAEPTKKPEVPEVAAGSAAPPPPPPPPPPLPPAAMPPGAAGATAADASDRAAAAAAQKTLSIEERMKRAQEIRERMLRQRQEQSTSN